MSFLALRLIAFVQYVCACAAVCVLFYICLCHNNLEHALHLCDFLIQCLL